MPTIEIDYQDFKKLLGAELPEDIEELNDLLAYVKGEVKLFKDEIHVELQDTNRPDLWCAEGLARALQGFLKIDRGFKNYKVEGSSQIRVSVDQRLESVRPYIACALVKDVQLNDMAIRQLMRLQDKMDQTYGRQRRRTSIGLYDFDLVTPPLRYGTAKPDEISFVPLGFEERLTLGEILERHPKGIEYGHIVRPHPLWPILADSKDEVLSFPPVINSNVSGRVVEDTRNVLIEVTGTVYETVLNTLTIVTLSLADRGGSIYSADIHYPYPSFKRIVSTPKLQTQVFKVDVGYARGILGFEITPQEMKDLLERSRFGIVDINEKEVTVQVPCYRMDIMHPIDIVEDIAIAYDYNRISPRWPQLLTIGATSPQERLRTIIRDIMTGLGFQEVMLFTMTNPDNLFTKMNLSQESVVEVANPRIRYLNCIRSWLLPSLMEFLNHNIHVEYPQRIFEVGYCVTPDTERENRTREAEKLGCVTIHSNANFTGIKAMLDAVFQNIAGKYELKETRHSSFIEGRAGEVIINNNSIGFIGEVHPQVLENWGLGNPAAAFEIAIDGILQER